MKIIEPNYIIVGSRSLFEFSIPFRKYKDVDVLVCDATGRHACKSIMRYDVIEIPKYILDSIPYKEIDGVKYATPDAVYTLKCSHLGWDIFFRKHKSDVLYLKSIGCNLLLELYYKLTAYWKETNGNKEFLDFYKTKKDFFNDYVNYIYDHDYLHEVISYPDKPLYLDCRYAGQEVAIDPMKFYALPKEKQIQFFREEITVIAAERWLIPKLSKEYNITQAYELAFHKMLISLTKDWQTDNIIFNIEDLVKPDYALFNKLKHKGIIKMAQSVENWKQIVNDIIDYHNSEENKSWNDGFMIDEDDYYEFVDLTSFGEFAFIEKEGGGEGGAEYCYFVFKWKDVYYRLDYNYYSHEGFNFDYASMYEVKPEVKTVTVYN